jgi:hypothetical protein
MNLVVKSAITASQLLCIQKNFLTSKKKIFFCKKRDIEIEGWDCSLETGPGIKGTKTLFKSSEQNMWGGA